jgi:hypothetical protein
MVVGLMVVVVVVPLIIVVVARLAVVLVICPAAAPRCSARLPQQGPQQRRLLAVGALPCCRSRRRAPVPQHRNHPVVHDRA